MLNKFQDQDLMSSVKQLEELKSQITDTVQYSEVVKIIDTVKNIKPSLFSYPKVAKYTTGKFDSTIDISDGEEWTMKEFFRIIPTLTITDWFKGVLFMMIICLCIYLMVYSESLDQLLISVLNR